MIISSSANTTLLQFIIHLAGPTKKMEKAKKRNRPNDIVTSYMLSSA